MSDLMEFLAKDHTEQAILKMYSKPDLPLIRNEKLYAVSKNVAFCGQKIYLLSTVNHHIPRKLSYRVWLSWELLVTSLVAVWYLLTDNNKVDIQ